ncbi:MAG: hypothetical protein QM744_08660 [Mesorhizobium sp.]
MSTLTDAERKTFAAIADYLIPEGEGMPSASQVGVPNEMLDKVVSVRSDLVEPLRRGLAAVADLDGHAGANKLNEEDGAAFHAISLAASGGYYMSPTVRQLIGYPGQESRPFDPDKTTEYLDDGLLQPVIDRGPIYRRTPDA